MSLLLIDRKRKSKIARMGRHELLTISRELIERLTNVTDWNLYFWSEQRGVYLKACFWMMALESLEIKFHD